MRTTNLHYWVLVPMGLSVLACSGEFCKDATKTVVSTTVSTTKNAATGLTEGIKEGRKEGVSSDGALIVDSAKTLEKAGTVTVHALEPDGDHATVVLAVENTGEQPMRLTGLEVVALDDEGFVVRPDRRPDELTVLPKSKDRLRVKFPLAAAKLKTIRIWGEEQPAPQVEATAEAPDAG